MDIELVATNMRQAASTAASQFFKDKLNGRDRFPCGFAWVTVTPKFKGNTRQGREERIVLKSLGFNKDWTGKSFILWNPSSHSCQNVYTKEAGAAAAARVLQEYGINAYAESRLD